MCPPKPNLWLLSNLLEPHTTILGNKELFIEAGSTINLTCIIQAGAMSDTHIFWNYDGKVSSQLQIPWESVPFFFLLLFFISFFFVKKA